MQGSVTQSYFILDVPSNKVARQIYYEIAEEYRGLSKAIHQGGKYERGDDEEDDEAGETESRAASSAFGMSISTNKQPYGDRRDGKKKKASEIQHGKAGPTKAPPKIGTEQLTVPADLGSKVKKGSKLKKNMWMCQFIMNLKYLWDIRIYKSSNSLLFWRIIFWQITHIYSFDFSQL